MDCGFEWERDGHVELSFMERRGELLPMIDGHVEYVNEEVVIASVPLMSEAWKDRGRSSMYKLVSRRYQHR